MPKTRVVRDVSRDPYGGAKLEEAPGNRSTIYQMYDPRESIGTIAIPVRDHISAATTTSLLMADNSWLPKDKFFHRMLVQGGILTMQRNESVQRMEGEWLLFIDDDMVFQPDAIGKLILSFEENDLDMLGGLCFRRQPPHQPTLYMREGPTSGAYNFLEKWAEDEIVEVDATGMAFVVIRKRVFERIAGTPMPDSAARDKAGPPNFFRWEGKFGEDLSFCQMAKASGSKIFVHTGIEIGHVGEFIVSKEWFWQQILQRGDEMERLRGELNDRMGLPTLTAVEAKELLGWK
jgi:hypothetical protein